MNKVSEYRRIMGITQQEFVDEVVGICPGITRPTVSLIENGVVEIPAVIEGYIDACIHDEMAHRSEENPLIDKCIDIEEKSLISGIFERAIYDRLSALKEGDRLTREELFGGLGISDRVGRLCIESMRGRGVRIASGGGKPGYYIARTEAEYRAFEKEYLARAYKAIKTAKAMRDSKVGQVVIDA